MVNVCVDYTDLNKHCPKDPFGLPRIDRGLYRRISFTLLLRLLLRVYVQSSSVWSTEFLATYLSAKDDTVHVIIF